MSTVAVGRRIPAFSATAVSASGSARIASRALAGQPCVLYFYPRDDTPGCTSEAQDFRDRHAKFRRHGARIIGVSRDSLASHEKFIARHGLPFDLISDPDEKLCRLFDVIREKNMYGRKLMGIERSTFLVDAAGLLVREWRKVKVKGHAAEVLEALESL